MCGPLWVPVTQDRPHMPPPPTFQAYNQRRPELQNRKSECGRWGRWEGEPGPLYIANHPPHTPRDCIVHNLPNGRSSPETQQGPRPQDGGCVGGFPDPLQIALDMSFPRTVEQLSHRRPPLCSPMCPFSVPSSLAQPLSCTQWDSHSHFVLWGHLWLGRAWC